MDSSSALFDKKELIRSEALRLGFDVCGFACADEVDTQARDTYRRWLDEGKQAQMDYLGNYLDLRDNPARLYPGARTVICVALNYYPARLQPRDNPQFAYYAYGLDYHEVMRDKLRQLAAFVTTLSGDPGRVCCDTAPLRERYWAVQAGLGFIGKNAQLIIPGKGSYFFLGELLTTLALPPDQPVTAHCGNCSLCREHCPTGALSQPGQVDARLCISCQTIENRGEIPPQVAAQMGNRVYGCDTCQQSCPWNQAATPSTHPEFAPSDEFLALDAARFEAMTPVDFNRLFRHSAVRRAKYAGLMRNFAVWKKNRKR
ncbi:MAG TPA: tRNA epoxyqueuosine(34) reductase QueG [Candidatus Barnesiella excrementavium]|nr:tRNA epoxyqueuosine(34) reductase QueG [Candidatus Barnesiella excrementavium]